MDLNVIIKLIELKNKKIKKKKKKRKREIIIQKNYKNK